MITVRDTEMVDKRGGMLVHDPWPAGWPAGWWILTRTASLFFLRSELAGWLASSVGACVVGDKQCQHTQATALPSTFAPVVVALIRNMIPSLYMC